MIPCISVELGGAPQTRSVAPFPTNSQCEILILRRRDIRDAALYITKLPKVEHDVKEMAAVMDPRQLSA